MKLSVVTSEIIWWCVIQLLHFVVLIIHFIALIICFIASICSIFEGIIWQVIEVMRLLVIISKIVW